MEGTSKTLALIPVVVGVSLRISLFYPVGYAISVFNLLLIHYAFLWGEVEIVKIKPMLVRLENAIGRDDLIEQMVLLPEPKKPVSAQVKSANLIVAYDASPNSHTALDIAFCIAHQTRLATNTQVTVQAVYVVENGHHQFRDAVNLAPPLSNLEFTGNSRAKSSTAVVTPSQLGGMMQCLSEKSLIPLQTADRIIWQARNLAEEWQGSFKSHLRFGSVATELKNVVELESADILFLGCKSVHHPIIQMLGSNFPCAVLGIPHCIDE
jgi:nucleotide-binding universal stress UspA family protein